MGRWLEYIPPCKIKHEHAPMPPRGGKGTRRHGPMGHAQRTRTSHWRQQHALPAPPTLIGVFTMCMHGCTRSGRKNRAGVGVALCAFACARWWWGGGGGAEGGVCALPVHTHSDANSTTTTLQQREPVESKGGECWAGQFKVHLDIECQTCRTEPGRAGPSPGLSTGSTDPCEASITSTGPDPVSLRTRWGHNRTHMHPHQHLNACAHKGGDGFH